MREKQLYILDAYGLIYRAYYAFMNTRMMSPKGINTSTVFGFMLALEDILKKQKPTHIAVAFDIGRSTFRHKMYAEYKANRDATPEEIKVSVPIIRQILGLMNIEMLEDPEFEADDIVGTLAKRADKEGFDVFMVTSDKDYCQLVDEHIFIYKPGKSGGPAEVMGVKEVCEKFEIKNPSQVIDVLALWGDSSDNIPGVPGVGEKTAKKLVAEFGSAENILLNVDKLSGKQKQSFIDNAELLKLSKELVTIELNVPIDFNEDNLKVKPANETALAEIFVELNFKTLINKFITNTITSSSVAKPKDDFGQGDLFAPAPTQGALFDAVQTSQYESVGTISHQYYVLTTDDSINELIVDIEKQKEFCFDTETTGLDPHTNSLVGISFSLQAHTGYYLPLDDSLPDSLRKLLKFKAVFENENISKIGHNLKFDILFLHQYKIYVRGNLFDTMLVHYLLHPEQNHKLDNLARKYFNYSPIPIENLIGRKGVAQLNMKNIPLAEISEYACEDSDLTWQLKEILQPQLVENKISDLYFNLEARLLKVLIDVELNGFKIDVNYLKYYSNILANDIISIENEIYKLAEQRFNLASPKQLGEVLFEKMKIPYDGKLTKTKQYSTAEETLLLLTENHPIISLILDYRGLTKLQSTYVETLPKMVNEATGKIHTSFNQSLAVTGRLSSSNPNLQNIPIRDARGREIRKAFIASEGCVILSADYSQIELRLMAHMSSDAAMIEAFSNNADIHTSTAAKVFKISVEEVTREQRSKAKTANFGIIYGITAFGLSQRMNIGRKEASDLIQEYFKTFPGVKQYMSDITAYAREHGYVQTLLGRRRYLADINSQNAVVRGMAERNAINAPIQGTAADVIKKAMIAIYEAFERENLQSKMILQVHDELVFDVLKNELEMVKAIVKHEMEKAMQLSVPLLVEMGTGNNWLEAH